MNEITARWDCTGLLENLDSEHADELASSLEKLSDYIVCCNDEDVHEDALHAVFTIVSFIYLRINGISDKLGKFNLIVDCEDLFWDVNKKCIAFQFEGITIAEYEDYCEDYCENYIEDLKRRRII